LLFQTGRQLEQDLAFCVIGGQVSPQPPSLTRSHSPDHPPLHNTQQLTEAAATVTGSIPAWLDGTLVINGGGDYAQMTHMFDGYALLAKAKFKVNPFSTRGARPSWDTLSPFSGILTLSPSQ
jgi:hypothetical protein